MSFFTGYEQRGQRLSRGDISRHQRQTGEPGAHRSDNPKETAERREQGPRRPQRTLKEVGRVRSKSPADKRGAKGPGPSGRAATCHQALPVGGHQPAHFTARRTHFIILTIVIKDGVVIPLDDVRLKEVKERV